MRRHRWPTFKRDSLMFGLGALGFVHEIFLPGPTERPILLGFCGILMGLPWVLPENFLALLMGRQSQGRDDDSHGVEAPAKPGVEPRRDRRRKDG